MKTFENVLESILWNVRYVMLLPVVVSLIVSLGVLLVTTIDALTLLGDILAYTSLDQTMRSAAQSETISNVVAIVDGYLLGAILLIFGLGLYELFVNRIDIAEGSEFANRLLLIRSLDDLKDRLANVILVVLIVKFFQQALKMSYSVPFDLLFLAFGVFLIGAALFLTGRGKAEKKNGKEESNVG